MAIHLKIAKLPFSRLFRKRNIFEQTQFRLTALYSGLLMLFLLFFTAVVYLLLYTTIFKNQERNLQGNLNHEVRNIESYLQSHNNKGQLRFKYQDSLMNDADQFFYYIMDNSGELVLGNEVIPSMRDNLLKTLSKKQENQENMYQETVEAEFPKRGQFTDNKDAFQPIKTTNNIRLLIAKHSINYHGEVIGTLYIGKDISVVHQIFKWLLLILLGLVLLFSVIALIISHYMSKKAMIPITYAFSRQQEFTADASHELRTPLSVMLSSINALELVIDLEEESYEKKIILGMKKEVKRMTGLVSDLLTLARSGSNAIELKKETFDLQPIVEEVINSVCPLAEAKEINLHYDTPNQLILIGDPQRLTQLLYILLDNAIKYNRSGGETSLSLSIRDKELWVTVKDTGIGIDPANYNRIFERFYRADQARSRELGGYGLGLSIAKWIVESHDGTIQVKSELDKGSTFIVRLPIQ